jgi:hypothetical protein
MEMKTFASMGKVSGRAMRERVADSLHALSEHTAVLETYRVVINDLHRRVKALEVASGLEKEVDQTAQ